MGKLDLEFKYEVIKRGALKKIADSRKKWEEIWAKAEGNPEAEAELISLKFEIDTMEKEVREELEKFEEELKAVEDID